MTEAVDRNLITQTFSEIAPPKFVTLLFFILSGNHKKLVYILRGLLKWYDRH